MSTPFRISLAPTVAALIILGTLFTVPDSTTAQSPIANESTAAIHSLSPELQTRLKRSLDAAAAVPRGGDIRGFVEARFANADILLGHAKVYLKRMSDNSVVADSTVQTNPTGRFITNRQPSGKYLACAEVESFESACADEAIEVVDHEIALKLPIALKPLGGVIRGRVTLPGGEPAAGQGMALYSPSGTTEVSLVDAGGNRVAGPVQANAAGDYIIANVKPGTNLRLRTRFLSMSAERNISLKEADLTGDLPFDILVPQKSNVATRPVANRPPPAPPPSPGTYSPPPPAGNFIDPTLFMGCANEAACETEAQQYYQSIGVFDVNNNPTASLGTLAAWRKTFGFSADPTKPAPGEVRAVYYNNADLRLGRDMHCLGPTSGGANINVWACYVTNFDDGHFEAAGNTGNPAGGDPQTSIARAEANNSPIATVAMVSAQQTVSPFTNSVSFYVYPADPTKKALVAAVLDSQSFKAVPGVCIACHGGGYVNHQVLDGRFLPFDTPTFIFDTQSSAFLEPSQREAFRQLNGTVKAAANTASNTITRDTIQNLIDGWYGWCGGVTQRSCYIDDVAHPFVPSADCNQSPEPATCGWKGASMPNFDPVSFYQRVPRNYCRTCHVAHSDAFNWQNFNEVSNNLSAVKSAVLNTHFMPYAEVPYNAFWYDFPAQDALGGFVGIPQFSTSTLTLTLVPSAGTDRGISRTITVSAKDSQTGQPVTTGSVQINRVTGTLGQRISYTGCTTFFPKTHVFTQIACGGSVTAPGYAKAFFTD
jgi:hypothetical protein